MMKEKGYMKNAKQLRDRWINYVDPNLKKVPLNDLEITQLFNFYFQYGSSWSLISKMMDNASPNMLKNTFYKEVNIIIKSIKKLKLNFLNLKSGKYDKRSDINIDIDLCTLEKLSSKLGIPIDKIKLLEKKKLLNEIKSLRNESAEKNSISKFYKFDKFDKESPIIESKDEIHVKQDTKNEFIGQFDLSDDKENVDNLNLLSNQIKIVISDNSKNEDNIKTPIFHEKNDAHYNESICNMNTYSKNLSNSDLSPYILNDGQSFSFQQDISRLFGSPKDFQDFVNFDLFKNDTP